MAKVIRKHEEDDCSKVSVDRISALPNEVLGFILSSLTFKEAIATSILSRRWKYTWTSSIPKLDLDGTSSLWIFEKYGDGKLLDKKRSKYVKWVDRLITRLQDDKSFHNLEEFKLMFDLTVSHQQKIDDWLTYAVSRKVESLELIFIDVLFKRLYGYNSCYDFPYKNGNFPNNLRVLKRLSTHLVNVTGEAVEMFLRNCPLLEQVSVCSSGELRSLEIIQTFPSFKCLEISYCRNLQSFVVRESGVVCIKYAGANKIKHVELTNVPLLTQLWIKASSNTIRNKGVVSMFGSVLPQLEMFKIYFMCTLSCQEYMNIVAGVEMRNLKELVVNIGHNGEKSLLPLIALTSVSHRLQRFVIEASHEDSEQWFLFNGRRITIEIPRKIRNHLANFQLKEIEFVGYRGQSTQFELIMLFVENNVALENIIVDPQSFKFSRHYEWNCVSRLKIEDEISARAHAKEHLKNYIPHNINVKIL